FGYQLETDRRDGRAFRRSEPGHGSPRLVSGCFWRLLVREVGHAPARRFIRWRASTPARLIHHAAGRQDCESQRGGERYESVLCLHAGAYWLEIYKTLRMTAIPAAARCTLFHRIVYPPNELIK